MYLHLSKEQRLELGFLLREGYSLRGAAKRLRVAPSTVSRELKRNASSQTKSGYHAGDAQRRVRERRALVNGGLRKIRADSVLEELLIGKIRIEKWSPEQVAGWLKAAGRNYVCAQTVYDWIYTERRELRAELHCRKGRYRRTRQNSIRRAARAELAKSGTSAEDRLKPRLLGTGKEIRWSGLSVPATWPLL